MLPRPGLHLGGLFDGNVCSRPTVWPGQAPSLTRTQFPQLVRLATQPLLSSAGTPLCPLLQLRSPTQQRPPAQSQPLHGKGRAEGPLVQPGSPFLVLSLSSSGFPGRLELQGPRMSHQTGVPGLALFPFSLWALPSRLWAAGPGSVGGGAVLFPAPPICYPDGPP